MDATTAASPSATPPAPEARPAAGSPDPAAALAALRADFNRSSRGAWGIIFDSWRSRWIGIRGKHTTVHASSPEELRERILTAR